MPNAMEVMMNGLLERNGWTKSVGSHSMQSIKSRVKDAVFVVEGGWLSIVTIEARRMLRRLSMTGVGCDDLWFRSVSMKMRGPLEERNASKVSVEERKVEKEGWR